MLATQEAQDIIVVKAMMTLEMPFVREQFNQFRRLFSKEKHTQTVYDRLYLDGFYRELRDNFTQTVMNHVAKPSIILATAEA